MEKRQDPVKQDTVHRDGKMAFSPQGRAIATQRINADKLSRIQKELGTDNTFSKEFKAAFDPATEYEQILERINLETELDAARKTITAFDSIQTSPMPNCPSSGFLEPVAA